MTGRARRRRSVLLGWMRKAVLGAWRQVDRISRGLQYVAVGMLRLSDVRSGIERAWSTFNASDANVFAFGGFFPAEREVVLQFVQPSGHVLVVGCGPGSDTLALLDRGCRVTGVEPSPAPLVTTRPALNPRAQTIYGYFEEVAFDDHFDVIQFSRYCYSYIPESSRRVSALQKAVRHLAPGGRILLNCVTSPETTYSRLAWIARAVGTLTRSDWRIEAHDELDPLTSTGDLFNYEHVFGPGELEAEVARAGLHVAYLNHRQYASMVVLTSEPTRNARPDS